MALGGGWLLAWCRWRLLTLRGGCLLSRRGGCRCPWRARCAGRSLPPPLILCGGRSGRLGRGRLRRWRLTGLRRRLRRGWCTCRRRLLRRRMLRNRRGRRSLCRPLAGRLRLRRTALAPLLQFLAYGGTSRLGRRRRLRALRLTCGRRRSRHMRGGRWAAGRLSGRRTFCGGGRTGRRMRGGRRSAGRLTGRRTSCGRRRPAGRSFRARRLARRLFRLSLGGLRRLFLGALGRGRGRRLRHDQRARAGDRGWNGGNDRQHAAGEQKISNAWHEKPPQANPTTTDGAAFGSEAISRLL